MIRFTVNIVPRGQKRARHFTRALPDGRVLSGTHKDKAQRDEEEKLGALILRHAPESPLQGPIECRIRAYMPIAASKSGSWKRRAVRGEEMPTGRPDLDNVAKNVLDVMSGVFFGDDRQIVDLVLTKRYGDPARYEIELKPAEGVPF